jgi:hypothetical protein
VLLLAGALLVWRGWRGVRVNEHPVCRGCGFDLVGTLTPGSTAGKVCPECGVDLLARGAVQHGQRRRRPVVVLVGCVVLLLGSGVGTLLVAMVMGGFDWNTAKPTWLLVREAEWPGFQSDLVLRELMVRRASGTLSAEAYRGLAEHGLAVQADAAAPWTALWGDLILDARDRGDLPLDSAHAFFVNSMEVAVNMRARVRAGAQAPYKVEIKTTRGATGPDRFPLGVRIREVRLHGHKGEERVQPGHGGMSVLYAGASTTFQSAAWLGTEPLTPGAWQAEVVFELDFGSAKRAFVHAQAIEVVEGPSARLVEAPGCIVEVREVRAELGELWKQHGPGGTESVRWINLTVHPGRIDRPASFTCAGRWTGPDGAEHEWALGTITLRPNIGVGWAAQVPAEFPADELTIVLRADADGAEMTPDLFEVPDAPEIVVPGVRVKR